MTWFLACPETGCLAPASVDRVYEMYSTDGPVLMAQIACVNRHRLNMPTEMLKDTPHQPSIVLELPPGEWWYCQQCQERWPCRAIGEGQ